MWKCGERERGGVAAELRFMPQAPTASNQLTEGAPKSRSGFCRSVALTHDVFRSPSPTHSHSPLVTSAAFRPGRLKNGISVLFHLVSQCCHFEYRPSVFRFTEPAQWGLDLLVPVIRTAWWKCLLLECRLTEEAGLFASQNCPLKLNLTHAPHRELSTSGMESLRPTLAVQWPVDACF